MGSFGSVWANLRSTETRVHVDSHGARQTIQKALLHVVDSQRGAPTLIVVCIGTDRSTGDALGPIIGTLLKDKKPPGLCVYGTLEQPVHAINLHEVTAPLSVRHSNAFVLAVDACLGKSENIGVITVGQGSLRPGAGVNKELPAVGDAYITGVVNVGGFMEYFVLQNTRLYLVYRLAQTIADGILAFASAWESKRTCSM
ncbi:MAG: spore protease YyaC [Selenomonadales bacterium]|nr:spore protease YyaC [Selenomonadales bacterium]